MSTMWTVAVALSGWAKARRAKPHGHLTGSMIVKVGYDVIGHNGFPGRHVHARLRE